MNIGGGFFQSQSPRPQSRGASRALGGNLSRQSVGPYGGPSVLADGSINPAAMFKDRFTNINTAKAQIEKQREREQLNDRLSREFAEIDVNGDGKVTLEELHAFLQNRIRVSDIPLLKNTIGPRCSHFGWAADLV